MSPDLKDGESSFKSSPDNVLRNRKLNGQRSAFHQRNASDPTNDSAGNSSPGKLLPGKELAKEPAREQKSNKVNKSRNSSNASDHSLDDSQDSLFSFQIRINLPVCCLFAVAFLMRFWMIDYPKSIV